MNGEFIPLIVYTADPTATTAADPAGPMKGDPYGNLWIRPFATDGGVTSPQSGDRPDADAVPPATVFALDSRGFLYGFNGVTWDRLRTAPDDSNGNPALATGVLAVTARLQAVNQTSGLYDRLSTHGTDSDAEAPVATGALMADAHLRGFNGASFDRLKTLRDDTNGQAAEVTGLIGTMTRLQAIHVTTGVWDRLAQGGCDADALGPFNSGLLYGRAFMTAFNGTNWDRFHANLENTLIPSGTYAANTASADTTNFNARGAHFIINVTDIHAGTPSVVPHIQGKDPISGNYYDLLVGAAITATGTTILKIYPGIGQVVNAAASDILPRVFRIQFIHADVQPIDYSVAAELVL